MFGSKFLEEKNGEQILLGETLGSKMGNKFFLKGIFLGGNFGENVLGEQILLGRKLCQQIVF